MDDTNLIELDLYELLDISPESTQIEIKKAYRKQALQCHPDKNPDNPNAAKEFHRLTAILEILTDEAARKAYDKVLKGRKEAALRNKELDSKRRKLKEDLELREKKAAKSGASSADAVLKAEIERLRKEGSKQVEEEVEFVMGEIRKQSATRSDGETGKYRIKVKWNSGKSDPDNGGYSQEMLEKFFSKYGDITVVVVSQKKKGSALVEFKTRRAAEMAVQLEIGLPKNPLKLEWLDGAPAAKRYQSTTIKDSDFESVVLTKMRQAEERKRLIEQMMKEDAEET